MSVREAIGGSHDEAAADDTGAASATPDPAADPAPEPAVPGYPTSRRPWVAGALGATWALCVGLALLACLVMAAWVLSPTPVGDSGAAWRAVGLTWLGAHQTTLTISGLTVSVLPLGAVIPGLLLTRRGGGWSARLVPDPSLAELLALVGGAALAYGAGGAGVAWLSATPTTGASLRDAFVACGAVAAAGSLWGIGREVRLAAQLRERMAPGVRRTLVAGWAGALGLFCLGAALVALSLLWHVRDAVDALAAVDGGVLALAGVTLADIVTLPTLAVWAAAFAAGPGFSLGQLGALSPFGGEVGALPALPVLVTIPAGVPSWAPAVLLGTVACGVLAGRVRWRADVPSWPGAVLSALGVGLAVAPVVAGAVLLTSGSLGGGALAMIGPELRSVTAAAVGLVVLGFLADAAARSAKLTWELHQANQRQEFVGGGPAAGVPTPQAPAPEEVGLSSSDVVAAVTAAPNAGETRAARLGSADQPAATADPTSWRRSLTTTLLAVGSAARSRVVWSSSSGADAEGAAPDATTQAEVTASAAPGEASAQDRATAPGTAPAELPAGDALPAEPHAAEPHPQHIRAAGDVELPAGGPAVAGALAPSTTPAENEALGPEAAGVADARELAGDSPETPAGDRTDGAEAASP